MYRSTVSSRIIGCCFAGALLWAMPGHVHAWGAAGHRIVGHMACDLLSPEARAAIQSLMVSVDLATFALHPDQRKQQLEQQIPGSRTWHYDNAPVCTTASYAQYCPNGACTSTQLLRHYRLLSDVHEPRSRKLFAIFVLTHLVGDIHQPLHAVWDTSLVEGLYRRQNEMTVAKRLVLQYAVPTGAWQAGRLDLVHDPGMGKRVSPARHGGDLREAAGLRLWRRPGTDAYRPR
jgi:hypothetical protein